MSTTIESDRSLSEPRPPKGTIAVDMDDVLCQTNLTIVSMHNEMFHTDPPLTLDDFQNYLYWQNRGWGTAEETVEMVSKLYAQGLYWKSPPVPGAKEGLLKLKAMGYDLIIITARSERQREGTEDWIAQYMPDIFDEIHFTGAFQHLEPTSEEKEGHVAKRAVVSHHKRSKAEIVHSTQSLFLIDDSAENALDASRATPPCRVILFGQYPWNAVVHRPELSTPDDSLTYVDKEKKGLLDGAKKKRQDQIKEGWLPQGVERVKDWKEVIHWVEQLESRLM
ncbi:HAD-like domain-containing protein [Naematelia encephala]|uniref:HAD-like domain-containing protein n=1 Tax=Naematelia encephala TaxID=71784 RepID=A0A1Y2BDD5_9TREE|nr:HAD-like domain-containing protein [Naematelia encephala]